MIECVPTLKPDVLKVATPEPFNVAVPRTVVPSSKVTVPVGVPEPGALAVTVVVNVTDWPKSDGLADELTLVLVPSSPTVWLTADDVLPVKSLSPPYTTVIECVPTDREDVLKVATPEPFSVAVPRTVVPSSNVIVPVGVPEPGALAVTVVVNVTDWPKSDGLAEVVTVVLVPSSLTVWLTADDVLPVKSLSPPYTTVIECVPTDSDEVLRVPTPEPFNVAVPRTVVPSSKVTVPVGVPDPGALAVTVVVNVTDWPKSEGLADELTLVLVPSSPTVWLTADDVLPVKSLSPPYTTVIECVPTEREDVLKVATPEPFSVAVPRTVVPSSNVTVPVGVPEPGALAVTVVVNVTDWP